MKLKETGAYGPRLLEDLDFLRSMAMADSV